MQGEVEITPANQVGCRGDGQMVLSVSIELVLTQDYKLPLPQGTTRHADALVNECLEALLSEPSPLCIVLCPYNARTRKDGLGRMISTLDRIACAVRSTHTVLGLYLVE